MHLHSSLICAVVSKYSLKTVLTHPDYVHDVSTNFLDVTQHHVMSEWAVKIISDWATHILFVDPQQAAVAVAVGTCRVVETKCVLTPPRVELEWSLVTVCLCWSRSRQSFVGWTLETSVGSASKNIAVYKSFDLGQPKMKANLSRNT